MLVLSRKQNERIVITLPDGRRVAVRVVELRVNSVRLGFDAPPDIPIWRKEISKETPCSTPLKLRTIPASKPA